MKNIFDEVIASQEGDDTSCTIVFPFGTYEANLVVENTGDDGENPFISMNWQDEEYIMTITFYYHYDYEEGKFAISYQGYLE